MKIDRTDERIMNELIRNSKVTLRALAERVDTSFVTVMKRVKRLEKEGVIRRYSTDIAYGKLGYDVHVIVDVRIAKGKLFELEKKIAMHPNVYAVYDTTGDFDAVVIGRFRTTKAMDNFLKDVQRLDFVERTNTRLVLNTIKEDRMSV